MPVNGADSLKGVECSASARELFVVKNLFVKRGQVRSLAVRQVGVNARGGIQQDVGVPKVRVKVNRSRVKRVVVNKRVRVGGGVSALQFRL